MHPHRRPAPGLTFRLDAAAVQLRDVLYDRETEPGPAQFPVARFIRPVKSLEDAWQIARRNTRSIVRDAESEPVVSCVALNGDWPSDRRDILRRCRADCK